MHAFVGNADDTLYITLGELRSRAAEAQEIAGNAAAERLTGTYIRAQAGQVARQVSVLRDDLAKAEAREGAPAATAARPVAGRLLDLTQTLAQRGESVTAAAALRADHCARVAAREVLERSARRARV